MTRKPRCHPHCKRGRHVFTTEECQRGFQSAIVSIVTRFPDAVGQDGRHMACNFLKGKNPLFFEARKLEKKLDKIEAKQGQQDKQLKRMRAELALLKCQAKHANTKPKRKRGPNGNSSDARRENRGRQKR